ncbi:MAG: hypothetical protein J7497_04740 [Chitinophagaceae bacterium]|nr:hypothetical protein [Chitinophagaceae bacterium]
MAITNDQHLSKASGTVDSVVYKKYYDKTVMSKKPDMSNRVLSEKQIEGNKRMQLATVYAKIMYATEERKMEARMRLKVPMHKSLFHALVKEHLDMNKGKDIEVIDKEINKLL